MCINVDKFFADVQTNGHATQTTILNLTDKVAKARDISPSPNMQGQTQYSTPKTYSVQPQQPVFYYQDTAMVQSPSLENLKQYICRWKAPQKSHKDFKAEQLHLTTETVFSDEFKHILGAPNTQDIQGID